METRKEPLAAFSRILELRYFIKLLRVERKQNSRFLHSFNAFSLIFLTAMSTFGENRYQKLDKYIGTYLVVINNNSD